MEEHMKFKQGETTTTCRARCQCNADKGTHDWTPDCTDPDPRCVSFEARAVALLRCERPVMVTEPMTNEPGERWLGTEPCGQCDVCALLAEIAAQPKRAGGGE